MNKEEIDKWLDNEYGVSYTSLEEIHDWLVDENMKKDKEIERLSKEVDMWNKKYNEQFDIINELEKWLEEQASKSDLKGCSFEQTYITGKWNAYKKSLNKLQELKGDSSNENN